MTHPLYVGFTFTDIYSNKLIAFISGMFSTSRFFLETMIVSEYRALPPQTGWTLTGDDMPSYDSSDIVSKLHVKKVSDLNTFNILQLAHQDIHEASHQSSSGWYYQILPSFFVGLTIRFGGAFLVRALLPKSCIC